jgi:hypothetical protein
MKKVFLSIFVFTALSSGLSAQSVFDKAAEDAANVICNCVNKTYKSMEEIAADETGEKGILFQECMESNTEKMKKRYENLESEPGFSDEMMFDLMLEKLAGKEKCALANMLMEMGRNANNTDETVEEEEDDSEGE